MSKRGFNGKVMKILISAAAIVCIAVFAVYIAVTLERVNIAASAIKRVPLPAGSVNETDYLTENYRIEDAQALEESLKHFYELTGVQPYVHIITSIDGSETLQGRDVVAYARTLYPQLFTDESHMLFLVYDNDTSDYYEYYIVSGSKAKTVMDAEAQEILIDCIRWYSYDPDLPLDERFSNAFSDAADRIMSITPPAWLPVPIVSGVLIIIALLIMWLRSVNIKKKLRAQQNAEILGMPLEQYGAETGAKTETPAQNYGSVSEDPLDAKYGDSAYLDREAHIKRLMDENAAETAKYTGLARQALLEGKEDDAAVFIEKKQKLEAARNELNAAYADAVSKRQRHENMVKGLQALKSRRVLAEKYAAQSGTTSVDPSGSISSAREELERMKKDMGL